MNKTTGEVLRDQAVIDRIAEAVAKEGGDAGDLGAGTFPRQQLQGRGVDPGQDIVEVWFDSAAPMLVLEAAPDLKWPPDLYLKARPAPRLVPHLAAGIVRHPRPRAFEAVLTHGFRVDEKARKMSKSLGNVVPPQDVTNQSGAISCACGWWRRTTAKTCHRSQYPQADERSLSPLAQHTALLSAISPASMTPNAGGERTCRA